jgi:hypothetical protein
MDGKLRERFEEELANIEAALHKKGAQSLLIKYENGLAGSKKGITAYLPDMKLALNRKTEQPSV